jgi:hypothetical protein
MWMVMRAVCLTIYLSVCIYALLVQAVTSGQLGPQVRSESQRRDDLFPLLPLRSHPGRGCAQIRCVLDLSPAIYESKHQRRIRSVVCACRD